MQEQHTIVAKDFMHPALQETLRCDASSSNVPIAVSFIICSNVVSICAFLACLLGRGK